MGWGKMKGEGDKMEKGKRFAELLGIDKSSEWCAEQFETCHNILSKDSELYDRFGQSFLADAGEAPFLLMVKFSGQEEAVTKMATLFFSLGYIKGRIEQEKIGGLEKLWKEE